MGEIDDQHLAVTGRGGRFFRFSGRRRIRQLLTTYLLRGSTRFVLRLRIRFTDYFGLRSQTCGASAKFEQVRLCSRLANYFSLSYSSSVTGSSHSLAAFSPGISKARCANQLSVTAPCQCFTFAGMWMTVPGRISTAGLPSS